ncbi:Calcium channel yvc1 [Didymosphaeria variabile]|uniref:Calcium channel yvc1 n=1 Tax=Didymosphaeria variabile TaxID=1932322 RepID=A0A9W8XKY4_9PLEO|nr:Calcium channel yvc1 [Didymosphaeria variabile]KAJ4353486.1 Calcium channel yvc1 [Didymosphaeria variabile]
MVRWGKLFDSDGHDRRHRLQDEMRSLLPTRRERPPTPPIPPKEVTKVALRLKHQIEQVVPCELEQELVVKPHSHIITPGVVATAKEAGGEQYAACVVYCLLVVKKWFKRQALAELWDADLHECRATAAEKLAKLIIEDEEDQNYLMEHILLKRYSIFVDGEPTVPANVIERAVDLHSLTVIGSSGYQKCIHHLWKGWLVQDDEDPSRFVHYDNKTNTSYWSHFDPDRMRVPRYQNALQIAVSVIFLALYTGAINTINPSGDLDVVEILLYIFTLGFICDETAKLWKVGRYYIGFWNVFNTTLYALLATSFILRMVAYGQGDDKEKRAHFNELSYDFLAFGAPMFWMRLLLYLDTFRFFGAMLVVLKVMMRESLIFFALLLVVIIGFLQAFIGLDLTDNSLQDSGFVIQAMLNAIMQSPEFDGFERFAHPFGLILYYIFTFVVMVILLNILIALYNSAYEDITENAIDEYMALFSQKTMQFVRAPDENVFIAPFNLIEMFCLILPFEWWMPQDTYNRLNDYVMGFIYSPLLIITAWMETTQAHSVRTNRKRGEDDDDVVQEWEQVMGECDFEADGWDKKVQQTKPNVEFDTTVLEVRKLQQEVSELKEILLELRDKANWGSDTLKESKIEDKGESSDSVAREE